MPVQPDPERRRRARIPHHTRIVLSGVDSDGFNFAEETETVTVSKFGLSVRTSYNLLVGQELSVRTREKNRVAQFQVVWTGKPCWHEETAHHRAVLGGPGWSAAVPGGTSGTPGAGASVPPWLGSWARQPPVACACCPAYAGVLPRMSDFASSIRMAALPGKPRRCLPRLENCITLGKG